MKVTELILYRDFEDGELLNKLTGLMVNYSETESSQEEQRQALYECLHLLVEQACSHGFRGNLWHCYLTNLLVNNENAYSTGCEMRGEIDGTINEIVLHDLAIFQELFDYDFWPMIRSFRVPEFALVLSYTASESVSKVYNTRICKRICDLAEQLGVSKSPEAMKETLTDFYREYGVGKFGLHKSFRVVHEDEGVQVVPIMNIKHVKLDDLVGYEMAKAKLVANTDAFVEGRKANNVLLFGDAGTGKSSCIKAIANVYYEKGLRVIELYKHQFRDLQSVITQIKNRNYRFIIYMDDLSFEDFEVEYKYLKAVIEGGLEKTPSNVLIYATSNRRHLIRENYRDKENEEDMHTGDTVQEKLSLAYRFGVTIYFGRPDKKEFQEIVRVLAQRGGLRMPEEELLLEANKWELSHGGLSGRTAQQFVDYLLGSK